MPDWIVTWFTGKGKVGITLQPQHYRPRSSLTLNFWNDYSCEVAVGKIWGVDSKIKWV